MPSNRSKQALDADRRRALRQHRLERARAEFQAGDFAACIGRSRRSAREDELDPESLHLLGAALVRRGDGDAGISILAKAQSLAPEDIALRIDHALALAMGGRLNDGIDLLVEGCRRQPDEPDLAAKLGELLSDAGRHDEAEHVLAAAVVKAPRHVTLRCLLAAECAGALKTEEALVHLIQAHVLSPGNSKILVNIGVLYQAIGDPETAIGYYRESIALSPEGRLARPNLATALLTRLDFAAGFAEFESRLLVDHIRVPDTNAPRWQGESLTGRRLLVTAEQGYGDMLQFARFLPHVAALQGDVTVECHPGLERLFATLPGVDRVVTLGQPLPDADATVPLLSLPFVCGCGIDDLSRAVPYLGVPPGIVFNLSDEPLFKVGLVWAGRPASGEVYVRRSLNRRSCSLAALAPLMTIPSVRFHSLQIGEAAQQLPASGLPIVDLSGRIGDFADTAAAIAEMDLVISVDTAVAHLAGAMGMPLWVLLAPGQVDYRWGLTDSTPWYPHARLFRAERVGWTSVIRVVAAELERVSIFRSRLGLQPRIS